MKKKNSKSYISLPNECYRTAFQVIPSNWDKKNASTAKEWIIWYRFYDPRFPKPASPKIRGMNKFKDLAQRQAYTQTLLDIEQDLIDTKGFNPITKTYFTPATISKGTKSINSNTGIISALDQVYEAADVAPATLKDLKSVLKYTWASAESLGIETKPISQVERSDIRNLLDEIGRLKNLWEKEDAEAENRLPVEKWTPSNYNHYTAYLGILFSILDEYDVYKVNPMLGIKKRKADKNIREILDDDEFVSIIKALSETDHHFWRFVNIFQESGCRRPEILGVQLDHVDMKNRRFKVFIKKGAQYKWVWKQIDESVVNLWQEIVNEAYTIDNSDKSVPIFLFNEGLRPCKRLKPIREEQITRRWKKQVKNQFNVTADLYSLKHRRTTNQIDKFVDAIIEEAGSQAANQNSHTNTDMVKKFYDVKANKRRQEVLQKVKRII